jgi:antitoxin (DNA-binding transcriptional repressor) of toxin-antitoxin stability system
MVTSSEGRQLDRAAIDDDLSCSAMCYVVLMARDITQRQLRNDSGEIMRGLDRGETFVVTRHGVPVGELTPLRRHRFVNAETAVAIFRGAPSVDLARLRADLDAVASQDPNPRA